ncbi:MAG TPA: hypothetical protein VJ898_09895 [Natrialbaceae archaeon]|nr:hypothetical protein [Natrialbaceae archaeon]
MASRTRWLAIPVVIVIVLAGAFAFTDFAAAEHRTNVHDKVVTTSTNEASMSVPATLHLYVVGSDPARKQVERTLTAAFGDRGVNVRTVTDLAPEYDRPVVLVAVREFHLSYSPVSPSATVSLGFEYAPNGNVTRFGQTGVGTDFDAALVDERLLNGHRVQIVLNEENTLFRSGEINLTDATTGVISWPGYRAHVLETAGENAVASLLSDAE